MRKSRRGARTGPEPPCPAGGDQAVDRLHLELFHPQPGILALLNTENLARARHLKTLDQSESMHSPFVEMIRTVVRRGVESGDFQVSVPSGATLHLDRSPRVLLPLQQRDLSVIFGRDLLKQEAKDERLEHMVALCWRR